MFKKTENIAMQVKQNLYSPASSRKEIICDEFYTTSRR